MKNTIKLFSVLALATVAVNIATPTFAATNEADTDTSVGFRQDSSEVITVDPEDPDVEVTPELPAPEASSLSLLSVPTEFNFGRHQISAADLDASNIHRFGVDTANSAGGRLNDFVAVWDGRITADDWTLSVSATPFESANGNILSGATLQFGNAQESNFDSVAGRSTLGNLTGTNMTITTDEASSNLLTADPIAKGQSNLFWDINNVRLVVAGDQLTYDTFNSTITWNLTAQPAS